MVLMVKMMEIEISSIKRRWERMGIHFSSSIPQLRKRERKVFFLVCCNEDAGQMKVQVKAVIFQKDGESQKGKEE